ncbi:MAG: protein translocase subunit SecD, partial [Rhodoferax sp.]
MNRYPVWKYAIIVIALLVGVIYTLPNFFGEAPAVQVLAANSVAKVDTATQTRIEDALTAAKMTPDAVTLDGNTIKARFDSTEVQLLAKDVIQKALNPDPSNKAYVVALNLISRSPAWLSALHAFPMYLGLDLRGGVYFMFQVDMQAALTQRTEAMSGDIRTQLREKDIRYSGIDRNGSVIEIKFRDNQTMQSAMSLIADQFPDLQATGAADGIDYQLTASIKPQAALKIQEQALKQNMQTLHNRINELGVAEPVILQQGLDRIVVQLPGVQDTAKAKE